MKCRFCLSKGRHWFEKICPKCRTAGKVKVRQGRKLHKYLARLAKEAK